MGLRWMDDNPNPGPPRLWPVLLVALLILVVLIANRGR